ncbi:response regulator containing cheY-like receiver, AAA-type ATPase [Candidatus Scalindua japonica]|uniref:Response regulator containing cheY-like receiver, AAA-type ATPase n=1 Tax=Candidatus Scalindua japonica TaxID=1284222 RepID=A0A286TTT2_9BACT|nr:response regulator [Candidatus Scalindua japonica]GAX59288.1 response regulator containing cheY-like receiver, AAA-type ATPase [Candidatus Scalindua japonica]
MQKVLICDPDKLFRWNLRYVLESKGFVVQEASRPGEAIKYVLKEGFAVVVFNLQSDDLNGVQIFSAIKAIDYKLPVIIVTDGDVTLSSVSSIIHESFRLLQKPVGYNEIEEAVRDAIQVKVNSK